MKVLRIALAVLLFPLFIIIVIVILLLLAMGFVITGKWEFPPSI